MNCHTFRRRASQLVDQKLEESESRQLKEHMAHCSACRSLYNKDLAIHGRMRKRAEIIPPEDLVERVEQAVFGKRFKPEPFPVPLWAQACVAAGAVLVSIAAGTLTGTRLVDMWDRNATEETEFLNLTEDRLSLERFVTQISRKERLR